MPAQLWMPVATYLAHAAPRGGIDRLLAAQRVLFCCQRRLLATVWVRSERGRHQSESPMPESLASSCTTLREALRICQEQVPPLLFLQHSHRALLEQAVKTHSDGLVLEADVGSGHVIAALRNVGRGVDAPRPSHRQATA